MKSAVKKLRGLSVQIEPSPGDLGKTSFKSGTVSSDQGIQRLSFFFLKDLLYLFSVLCNIPQYNQNMIYSSTAMTNNVKMNILVYIHSCALCSVL